MTVGILGTGNMGKGIALAAARAGERVVLGSREAARGAGIAATLNAEVTAGAGHIASGTYQEAARAGDLVVLATPTAAAPGVLAGLRSQLTGRIVIDVTNNLARVDGVFAFPGVSAFEANAAALGAGAHLVGAFKTTYAAHFANPGRYGVQLDVFVFGDHEASRRRAAEFVERLGFRPVDLGPATLGESNIARLVEAFSALELTATVRNGWAWSVGHRFLTA